LLRREGRLPPGRACRVVVLIARAVQVAHEAGVRHRDLKPSNIMVQDGQQPVVMDFGLARRGLQDPRLTGTGVSVGTPAYMPPEQTAGAAGPEPAADLYSLGVILYELLTGRLPFQGSRADVLRAVLSEPAPPPRQFQPDIDPGLEAICLQALAKD